METFAIKGRITPYTPTNAYRNVSMDELPRTLQREIKKDQIKPKSQWTWKHGSFECIVNTRQCRLNYSFHDKDKVYCHVSPIDKPLPPRKPRKTEQEADALFIRFCQKQDWHELLRGWEYNGRGLFRGRILERLQSIPIPRGCDNCDLKFQCFTKIRMKTFKNFSNQKSVGRNYGNYFSSSL